MNPHDHELAPDMEAHEGAVQLMWKVDNVQLTTVGIDIGSATSQVVFSDIVMRRQSHAYSSRFVVVRREALYESPILLTPYRGGELIDVEALEHFVTDCYRQAGLDVADVDAGAVILTGVAIERANAHAIAEMFAADGGKFVCATAGHLLEALLAGHGSGAVEASKQRGSAILNVDIGGGTTKLTLVQSGVVTETVALDGGGRLVAWDSDGVVTRIERAAVEVAEQLGIELAVDRPVSRAERRHIAEAFGKRILAAISGPLDPADALAGERTSTRPDEIVLSGGVAQYLQERDGDHEEHNDHHDLGADLADVVRAGLTALGIPVRVNAAPIRATVVGASQYSVQLSGNTVHLAPDVVLPIHNIPVAIVSSDADPVSAVDVQRTVEAALTRLDLAERSEPVAIAVDWEGVPTYQNLSAIAAGLHAAHDASPRRDAYLILVFTSDIAQSVGRILSREFGHAQGLVVVDGVQLAELDFLDLGAMIAPANVVPVIIKSLLFPASGASNHRQGATEPFVPAAE